MSRVFQVGEGTSIRGVRAVKYFSPGVLSPWHRFSWKLRTRVMANVTSREKKREEEEEVVGEKKEKGKEKHIETFQQLTEIFQ